MNGTIYKITCLPTGKSYIGATFQKIEKRIRQHRQDANRKNPNRRQLLHKAIRELGFSCFEWEILDHAETKFELIEKEGFWIKNFNTLIPNGFNTAEKGSALPGEHNPFFGKHHTDTTKEIIRQIHLGTKASKETKLKMSLKRKGVPKSPEWCLKMSLLTKGRISPLRGRTVSEETKRKVSQSKIGRKKINGKMVYPDTKIN